ncbi:MAG: AB hydrolase superfamily protein YvaM [Chloroflexi bacterium ADurb.Bin120]|jgi:pimeloyl-ACP methyl ester carboxylesterase|nr:MAG: AB hydrolase superfamily protein YvaM [Chloroflexi bacterium ADurb.Bin120]HQP24276.1 alpha/beta hydrolase [Smithellaceae bacterium]
MIEIDMQKFFEEIGSKYIVKRFARGLTGTLKLGFDDFAWVITFENGIVKKVEKAAADITADIFICPKDEEWKKILAQTPPPFYNAVYIASTHHGVKVSSGVKTMQYTPLIDELIRQMRAFYNGKNLHEISPQPHQPNVRFENVTGHYVYLTIDGIEYRVFYEEAGQGIPFLLQHTAGANSQEYRKLMNDPEFTKDFRFIAYDLPYHGKSLPPEDYPWWEHEYTLSLDFLLKFLDAFTDALKLERSAYMGCSMGGHLAPDLAYYRPEKFRAVVGIGAGLTTVKVDTALNTLAGLRYVLDNPQLSNLYIGTTNEAIVALPPYSSPNSQREVGWDYSNAYPGVFAGDLYYYMLDHNLVGKAQDIDTSKCMLYMLTGTYDPGTPPEITQSLADQVKGSKLTFMEGVGHYAMLEAYPTFKKYFTPIAEEIKTLK